MSLNGQERELLRQANPGSECVAHTVARIYLASNKKWKYMGICGILELILEERTASWFFVVVDPMTGNTEWRFELTPDMDYVKDKDNFHSFVRESELMGFLLADGFKEMSNQLFEKVISVQNDLLCTKLQVKNLNRNKISSGETSSSGNLARNDSLQRNKNGSFGIRNWSISKMMKRASAEKTVVSAPSNFRHISHVGYDAKTGYKMTNIPSEWKVVFEKAGITEEQLNSDPGLAKVARKFIRKNINALMVTNGSPSRPSSEGRPTPSPRSDQNSETSRSEYVKYKPKPPPPVKPKKPEFPHKLTEVSLARVEPKPKSPDIAKVSDPAKIPDPAPRPIPDPPALPPRNPLEIQKATKSPTEKPKPLRPDLPVINTDLLESIRSVNKESILRRVNTTKDTSSNSSKLPANDTTNTLAEALKGALIRRNAAVGLSDSDPDSSSSDSWT